MAKSKEERILLTRFKMESISNQIQEARQKELKVKAKIKELHRLYDKELEKLQELEGSGTGPFGMKL